MPAAARKVGFLRRTRRGPTLSDRSYLLCSRGKPTPFLPCSEGFVLYCKPMNTQTFSVRLDRSAKTRLQKLAKSTGRSRAFLAAEAIHEYLDVNEWQVEGIVGAIASLDR